MGDESMIEKGGRSSTGFYKKSITERVEFLSEKTGLTEKEISFLHNGLSIEQADAMVENVIGAYALPFAIATNFIVDGRETFIPMVTEEASVVAGASKAAKMFSAYGGFHTEAGPPLLKGQIQIIPQTK